VVRGEAAGVGRARPAGGDSLLGAHSARAKRPVGWIHKAAEERAVRSRQWIMNAGVPNGRLTGQTTGMGGLMPLVRVFMYARAAGPLKSTRWFRDSGVSANPPFSFSGQP